MTPPAAVVEKRRDLLTALSSVAMSAAIHAVPADFQTWAAALKASEYQAWRLLGGEITVVAVGEIAGRPIRVTAVFSTTPSFMPQTAADQLPAFDSPAPAARLAFPEAA